MANPEWIVASAGALSFGAGFVQEGGFPEEGMRALFGTGLLILVAAALGRTRLEPIVTGFAWLLLMVALYKVFGQRKQFLSFKPRSK